MSGSVNCVMLTGYLGRDPEGRDAGDGTRFVRLAIATSRSWKDKETGQRKEKTQWHRVVVTPDNKGAGAFAEKFLRKGSLVHVTGELQYDTYTGQDGVQRHSVEIVVDRGGQVIGLDNSKRITEAA